MAQCLKQLFLHNVNGLQSVLENGLHFTFIHYTASDRSEGGEQEVRSKMQKQMVEAECASSVELGRWLIRKVMKLIGFSPGQCHSTPRESFALAPGA